MSSYVEVRGVKIGEGVPKICVPIVGKTKEEILAAAKSFADVKMDVVEWRVDWFDGVFDFAQVEDVLKDLRPALGIHRSCSLSVPQKRVARKQSSRMFM